MKQYPFLLVCAFYLGIAVLIVLFKHGITALPSYWPLPIGIIVGTQFIAIDKAVTMYLKKQMDEQLYSQNIIFMTLWAIVAIFAITSTTSMFGKGFLLGLGLQLIDRIFRDKTNWLFWPIKRQIPDNERVAVKKIALVSFLAITLLI